MCRDLLYIYFRAITGLVTFGINKAPQQFPTRYITNPQQIT